MSIIELVFTTKKEMIAKMEADACVYEGFVPGRNGYNFPSAKNSYTIAYVKGDVLTKTHEKRHAIFFFDKEYREEVQKLWDSLGAKNQSIIEKFLEKCGYDRKVFLDEFQAYATTEKNPDNFFGIKGQILKNFRHLLGTNYKLGCINF